MKFGDIKKVSSIKLIPRNMGLFSFKCFLFFMCLSSCFHENLTDKPKETLLTVLNKCTFSTDSGNSPSPYSTELSELYEKWKFSTSSTDDVLPEIIFNVRSFQPKCSEEETSIEVTFAIDKDVIKMEPGNGLFRNLTTNGELIWEDSDGHLHSSMSQSFCVNINPNKTGDTLSFMTCKSKCTVQRPCVRKCCPPNSIFDMESRTCTLTTKIWEPFFYSAVNHKAVDPKSYSVNYGFPSCTSKYIALANSQGNTRLNLLLNGSLAQVNGDSSVSIENSNEFCIDGFPYHTTDGKQNENHLVNYSGSEWDQIAIICVPEPTVLNQCTDSYGEAIYSSEYSPRNSNYYFGNWFQDTMKELSEESKFNFFSLKPFQPNCAKGDTIIRVSLIPDESPMDYNKGSLQNLTATGELIWKDSNGYFHSSKPHAYCVNINPKDRANREVSFMTCRSGCTVHRPCVRKCCPPNRILDVDSKTCNLTRKIWEPFFYSAVNHKVHKTEEPESYSINYGFPSCASKYIVEAKSKGDMRLNLLLNGSLVQINKDGSVSILNSDEFCMDGFPYYTTDGKPNENNLANYSGSEWDQIAIICTPIQSPISENQTDPNAPSLLRRLKNVKNIVTAVLITISAICLLLMDIVYLILWKYKNIHEWLQFSCATSFLVAFTALAIAQTFSIQINEANPDICKILGIVIYFSFLCAFFWMTSINADLWFRFNGCRPLRTRSKPTEDRKKYFFFALFSLGIPFLIAGTAVALDNIYMDNPNDAPIALPGFGQSYCYFKGKMVELPYAKGPQAILFVFNIIFFLSTALYLRHYQKDTELARTNSNSDDKKGNFRLLAKLFIVMGILWIFELISWSAAVLYPDNEILTLLIFLPADVLNALQGVAIFIIYVCKPNTINQLKATLIRKPSIKSIKTIQGTV